MSDGLPVLMRAQIAAEMELAHDKLYISRRSLYQLINALAEIASNGTACRCCQMGAEIAHEALERFEHQTGISREHAYQGMRPSCPDTTV